MHIMSQIASSADTTLVPDKEGWLWKKGGVRKNWKKRWFVLAFNALAYFESQNSTDALGIIPLDNCVLEENGDTTTNYRFSFILFTPLGRDFCMRTTSEEDVIDWLLCINSSISNNKQNSMMPRRTKHQTRLWLQMLRKHFKEMMSHPRSPTPLMSPRSERRAKRNNEQSATQCPTFGAPLEEVLTRDGVEYRIPYIARKAIEYLETNALEVKGLFRMSGDNDAIQDLRTAVEEGENIDLFKVKDPHNVSCLLKLYIRELPEPLGTFARYDEWLRVSTLPSEDEQIETIKKLIWDIPQPNRDLLRELCIMLGHVADHSDTNNMTIKNLAIVFAPNFFRSGGDDMLRSLQDAPHTLTVTRLLIENKTDVFKLNESSDDENNGDDEEHEEYKSSPNASQSIEHAFSLASYTNNGSQKSDNDNDLLGLLDLIDQGVISFNMVEEDPTLILLYEMRCVLRGYAEKAAAKKAAEQKERAPESVATLTQEADDFLKMYREFR